MNKQKLIDIGKSIKATGLNNNGNFKSLMFSMSGMQAEEICDKVILMCLEADIECGELIEQFSEFRSGNIAEKELKTAINFVLL